MQPGIGKCAVCTQTHSHTHRGKRFTKTDSTLSCHARPVRTSENASGLQPDDAYSMASASSSARLASKPAGAAAAALFFGCLAVTGGMCLTSLVSTGM